MALNLRGVHVFQKIPGKAEFRLAEVHPAVRITKDDLTVFLQDGLVYDAGGNVLDDAQRPGWFMEELKKMQPSALREAGFKLSSKGV